MKCLEVDVMKCKAFTCDIKQSCVYESILCANYCGNAVCENCILKHSCNVFRQILKGKRGGKKKC